MFKNRVVLSVLLVTASLATAVPAFANGTVVVYPTFEAVYPATVGDTVHLNMGWIAATQGQVRVFIRHSSDAFTLVGPGGGIIWTMPSPGDDSWWGPVEPAPDDWMGLECPMPTLWIAWWDYDIPGVVLQEGTYTLTYTGTFDQPVNDGLHACVELPGTDPVPTPSLYRGVNVVVSTIVVSPPLP